MQPRWRTWCQYTEQFWAPAWGNHHRININAAIAFFTGQSAYGFQNFTAVRALPGRIRIREMPADISQTDSAQHGIADGMQQHISV